MQLLQKLKNKKILITGGAGFIGSNLCEFFVKNNIDIVCLDNFSTGFLKNISHLLGNKNFKLIEGDIRDLDTCYLATKNVDYVLHHAALGSVPRSIKDPLSTNDVNINGFLNILLASKDNKVKKFIYAASSSTYGDSKITPKVEHIIGKPLSPYAVTKYVNELYANIFSDIYGVSFIGLRYFNVFGRRQDPNGAYAAVIPKFINNLLNYQSITINGDGSFSRDFTYIDNVIQMNLLALNSENKTSFNQIYNTATGGSITLNSLVDSLVKYLIKFDPKIKDIKVIYGPEREGDIPHSFASIQKAKDILNYHPLFSFEEGIEKTINWYIKNR